MKKTKKQTIWLNLAVLVLLLLLTMGGIFFVAHSSEKNAKEAGHQLAKNYYLKDSALLIEHRTILNNAALQINLMKNEGYPIEKIVEWLDSYSIEIIKEPNSCFTGVFAVIDGEFYSQMKKNQPEISYIKRCSWYMEALKRNGKIYYSDVYIDIQTNNKIITMSKSFGDGDVVGIDIHLSQIQQMRSLEKLKKDSLQATFDRNGNVVVHKCCSGGVECNHDIEYMNYLYKSVKEHPIGDDFSYIDLYGKPQMVYSSYSEFGWISVASISNDWSNGASNYIILVVLLLTAVHFTLIVRMVWGNYQISKQAIKSERTIHALSKVYYEIYLLDIEQETFQTVKPSADLAEIMGDCPSYPHFMKIMQSVIEPQAAQRFTQSLSISNIRKLMQEGVNDFGGNFQRKFGDEYEWVNIQLLFDVHELHENEVIFAFQKINYRKNRELQQMQLLKDSIQEAKAASQAKNEFLSNMSHDMRTPLNAIIGLSQLAATQIENTEQVKDYLRKINFSSKHLLQLINNLLDMMKIEQGKMSVAQAEFDLKELIETTTDIFQPEVKQQNKTLGVTVSVTNQCVISDSLRISQILNNLLSNAIKFTKEHGKISVDVKQSPSNYREFGVYQIQVKDTGIGMSKEFLNKIFLPFEQEECFLEKRVIGTGLGMPIVKNLVDALNGTIQVESELGKGTTFTLSLPLQIKEDSKEHSNHSVSEKEQDLAGFHILLAEDNQINMEIAKELLEMNGIEVVEAWNGKEAVEQFEKSEEGYFDAILMDMQMPELDGCGAARQIRAMSRSDATNVPIFAVTANAFSDDIARSMESGMNAHISKPIDFHILMQTLRKFLK